MIAEVTKYEIAFKNQDGKVTHFCGRDKDGKEMWFAPEGETFLMPAPTIWNTMEEAETYISENKISGPDAVGQIDVIEIKYVTRV